LQLDSGNTAVQPKLALIRELFGPVTKGGRPAAAAAAPAPAPTVVAKAPVAATAPAPAPAARPAAAATAAAPAPASTPAPAPTAAAVPSPAPAPSSAAAPAAGAREVETALNAWATAWSSKDINGYLGAYSRDFNPPGNLTRKAWEDERRARIVGKSRISVRLSDVAVTVNGTKAVARFKQAYSADTLNVSSRKTVEMQKVGDRWVIVRENVGA
jgi:ketosteroid isomerase-like protein